MMFKNHRIYYRRDGKEAEYDKILLKHFSKDTKK